MSSTLASACNLKPAGAHQLRPERALGLADVFVAAGLFIASFALFSGTLAADFINYDDDAYVCRNSHVQSGLTMANMRWAFTTFEAGNWHPLTWLSLELDESMWGKLSRGFHFTNVLLHSANAAMLFLALTALTRNRWQSAVVAGLFAWHPLRVESVAWVAERKDVLSTFFWVLALAAYAWYARFPSLWRYVAVLGAYALGLMAKPMVITLPLVLLLLDYWPLGRCQHFTSQSRTGWRWLLLVLEKLPFLALLVGSALITLVAQANTVQTLEQFPFRVRLANALLAYVGYLTKTVWPVGLTPFYPHPRHGVHMFEAAACLVALIVVTLAAWKKRYSKPYFIVGWLWFIGTLIPVIGLIQVGHQALADRYSYIPSIGIFIAATWAVSDLARVHLTTRWPLRCLAAAVFAMCAVTTIVQAGYWRDSVTLWRHATLVEQRSDMAHFLLGAALERQLQANTGATRDRLAKEGLQEFVRAYTLNPASTDAHNNAGTIQRDRGDLRAAMAEFRAALAIDPNNGLAHYNLAQARTVLGQFPDAVREYQLALKSDATWSVAHNGLGQALAQSGQIDAARQAFEEAVKEDPNSVQAYCNLGLAYSDLGRPDNAIESYRKALSLEPDHATVLDRLGLVYLQKVDYEQALDCFQKAVAADPILRSAHEHLGMSLILAGRTQDALPVLLQAAEFEPPAASSAYDVAFAYHRLGQTAPADRWREKALALDSSWPATARDLAWRFATDPRPGRRNGSLGLYVAREIVELAQRSSAPQLDALAAALAECGRFDEAVVICRQAIERAADQQQRQPLLDRLALYQSRRPFRDSTLHRSGNQT